jgi:C-terminal processing protease CtpA/Prc
MVMRLVLNRFDILHEHRYLPLLFQETVIVIRSLVPGGVAQQDGRLIPGDRLMFVNDCPLEHASLDTAVQAGFPIKNPPIKTHPKNH